MSGAPKVLRFRPRFSLRLLLVVVTLSAIGFGTWRILCYPRPVTVKESDGVKVGMTELEVRWHLGGPHEVLVNKPKIRSWRFNFAVSEERPYRYFNVVFHGNRVTYVEETPYIRGFLLDVF